MASALVVLSLAGCTVLPPAAGQSRPTAVASISAEPTGPLCKPAYGDRDGGELAEFAAEEIQDLLDTHAAALVARDRAAFLAAVDQAAPEFVASETALFDRVEGVPLATWTYQLGSYPCQPTLDPIFERYGAPVVSLKVQVGYQLAGIDPEPTYADRVLTIVDRGTGWTIGSDADRPDLNTAFPAEIWDFGPVVATSGTHGTVFAHPGNAEQVAGYVALVDQAVSTVSAVWGTDWSQQVAVVAPETAEEMAALIGEPIAVDFDAVADADAVDLEEGVAFRQRVIVDPEAVGRLDPADELLLLSHEITHIASAGATAPTTPIWLIEGLAEYVSLRDSGWSPADRAWMLADEVRAGAIPPDLPTDADFADPNRYVQAYDMAWLACQLIAERAGPEGLVRLYRAVGDSDDPESTVDSWLWSELGMSRTDFVAAWQQYLTAQLA